jgi:hypothetical protein
MNARLLSSSAVLCNLPPSRGIGNVTLEVSNNGVDFGVSFVLFQFMPDTYVTSLVPSSDTLWGGSRVTITGQGFDVRSALWCKFGVALSAARALSATALECISPAQPVGEKPFMIFNMETEQGTNSLPFRVTVSEMPEEQVYSSAIPSFGPDSGGTVVLIRGGGFKQDVSVCRFGQVRADARVISASEIECVSPTHEPGCIILHVVRSDKEEYDVFGKHFCFQALPSVMSITPSHGLWHQQQVVTVTGANFQDHPSLLCRVGESVAISARWLADSMILCKMSPSVVGNVSIEVSNNGVDFSADGVTFEARKMLYIEDVKPSAGYVVGGTTITVQLSQDIDMSQHQLSCRFGQEVAWALPVGDQISRQVSCNVPAVSKSGRVSLVVADGAVDLTAGVDFYHALLPVVTDLFPMRGPVAGSTPLRIRGRDFAESLTDSFECRLGAQTVRGSILSSSEALCITPAHAHVGAVPLEISSTGAGVFHTTDFSLTTICLQLFWTLYHHGSQGRLGSP